MTKLIKDGWHTVDKSKQVYTENGLILKAVKKDCNGSLVRAQLFKKSRRNSVSYESVYNVKYSTFKRSTAYMIF